MWHHTEFDFNLLFIHLRTRKMPFKVLVFILCSKVELIWTRAFRPVMAQSVQFSKKLFRPEKFNLSSGAQVKPCRSGYVTHRECRLKGPYVVLSFLLLLFCVLCGVIVNSVLKSRFSIICASGFRKRKKTKNKYGPVQFARKLLFFGP